MSILDRFITPERMQPTRFTVSKFNIGTEEDAVKHPEYILGKKEVPCRLFVDSTSISVITTADYVKWITGEGPEPEGDRAHVK